MPLALAYSSAFFAAAIAFAVMFRERRSMPHWFFVSGMVACAMESLFSAFAMDALLPEEFVYWQNWRLFATSLLPGLWLFFSLTYSRGNVRECLRTWRFPLLASILLPVALASGICGRLIVSISKKSAENQWLLNFATSGVLLNLFFLIVSVLVLMNLERTFRATVGTMRWRVKFMILGVGVLWAVRAYTSSQTLLFRAGSIRLQALDSAALFVACILLLRSLARAGCFEVRVYPSSSVLHSSFTILLAGVYLITIGALSKAASLFGTELAFEVKAFLLLAALVMLTVLLLSETVRSSTRRFVSRHFHRPLYDYRTIWRDFTKGTARCLEQSELCEAVAKLISEIFQALSVTIWLLDGPKEELTFAASTSLSRAKAGQLRLERADLAIVLQGLRNHPEPIDIDSSKEIWAVLLRRLHPDEFQKGGNRICVPMLSGSELLGLITLGDRVGGVAYWSQDFDLLKTINDQAAACLLNIQLSQRLLQAKQVEAFQTMSTFFVHDLKNTASTLSLMLQNLPVHFNDPAFREDALRGVSRTVTHINDLIGRLGLLRQELGIQSVESDLNELVTQALKRVDGDPSIELVKELGPLPKLRLDPAQIQNVVTNLVLNAKDAVAAAGQIRIATSQQNGWVVLAVTDNGCGMTSHFIQHSLFRPFQTTKQKGIGIGMFQCKTIVEAHHGRIEVDSIPGKGTSFRVLLPVHA
jgi:putative PEP-CTERM system histidine kinase